MVCDRWLVNHKFVINKIQFFVSIIPFRSISFQTKWEIKQKRSGGKGLACLHTLQIQLIIYSCSFVFFFFCFFIDSQFVWIDVACKNDKKRKNVFCPFLKFQFGEYINGLLFIIIHCIHLAPMGQCLIRNEFSCTFSL